MTFRSTRPAPSHLALVALILFLWHGALGADYVLERFALSQPEWPALMRTLPFVELWQVVVWAGAVWLGVAAAIFLVLRDNASVLLFFCAAACGLALGPTLATLPAGTLMFPGWALAALMVVLPGFGWLYARALNRANVLN